MTLKPLLRMTFIPPNLGRGHNDRLILNQHINSDMMNQITSSKALFILQMLVDRHSLKDPPSRITFTSTKKRPSSVRGRSLKTYDKVLKAIDLELKPVVQSLAKQANKVPRNLQDIKRSPLSSHRAQSKHSRSPNTTRRLRAQGPQSFTPRNENRRTSSSCMIPLSAQLAK